MQLCNRLQPIKAHCYYTALYDNVSDLEQKQVPTVLLLYSYDCSAHEKVVEALAGFLIETCNCNVHVDMFEEQIIHERGLDDWLVDNLQEAEFIIVLSSVGARLRCSKKKVKFKLDPGKTLPDYFAVAVDYVAEKMRVERSKSMPLTTFCVAYMDYSSVNDIPPQLEMAFKFCLMKDITSLFCHLHGINGEPTKDGAPIVGLTPDTFDTTEMGQELRVAMESAKEFFKCNPDWVEGRIEPIPNPVKKSRHARKSSQEPLLLASHLEPTSHTPPVHRHAPDLPSQAGTRQEEHSTVTSLKQPANQQNSFPVSPSGHKTLANPTLELNSKSCDNVPVESQCRCDLCGLEGHVIGSSQCKLKHCLHPEEENGDNDDGVKLKSKSMPAVNRNSLYSSQTIFRAEVHKEWDDGSLSHGDSQETQSNPDSSVDDLERDLDSIMNPTFSGMSNCRPSYSHASYDNLTGVYNVLTFPTKGDSSTEIVAKKPERFIKTEFLVDMMEPFVTKPVVQKCDIESIRMEEFSLKL